MTAAPRRTTISRPCEASPSTAPTPKYTSSRTPAFFLASCASTPCRLPPSLPSMAPRSEFPSPVHYDSPIEPLISSTIALPAAVFCLSADSRYLCFAPRSPHLKLSPAQASLPILEPFSPHTHLDNISPWRMPTPSTRYKLADTPLSNLAPCPIPFPPPRNLSSKPRIPPHP